MRQESRGVSVSNGGSGYFVDAGRKAGCVAWNEASTLR